MELIRAHYNLRPSHKGCVATLGNFDGVHLGHQQVLKQMVQSAKELRLPSLVITTEPLSREYFAPDTSPPRLTRLREKLAILKTLGVDRVLCLRFDAHLANLPAESFVKDILVSRLGIRHLVVGDDTRFGKNRGGDFNLLCSMGRQYNFTVESTQTLSNQNERISSTRIRNALKQGQMDLAATLLNRHYHMSGRVAHGDKRGRTLGYPTANIHLQRKQTPLMGIFAVEVGGLGEQKLPAVASIGVRPTFGQNQCLLEVHLFDFDKEIYGQYVDVYFMKKLRDEKRFDSVERLVAQMNLDAQQARNFFAQRAANV